MKAGAPPDDEALLVQISGGDEDAFGELYARHAGSAFNLARAICRDPGRAEDAVQEAFLAIWRSPGPTGPSVALRRPGS